MITRVRGQLTKLDIEQENKFRELHSKGYTDYKIGKFMDLPAGTVRNIRDNMGLPKNSGHYVQIKETLCWKCANCNPNLCQWHSRNHKPMFDDWELYEATKIKMNGRKHQREIVDSFRIIKCKQFKPDKAKEV